jgi:hydrogenase nickel incorporation protein HypA/HybF
MHEYGIALGIIQIVLDEAKKARARSVKMVSLKVGELAAVMPDSLSFCFEFLARSTIAEHATLTIEKVPARGHCAKCNRVFLIEQSRYQCELCGNNRIELVSGNELQIDRLEIEDEAD